MNYKEDFVKRLLSALGYESEDIRHYVDDITLGDIAVLCNHAAVRIERQAAKLMTLEEDDGGVEENYEKVKTNEEYIYEAVELSWRWHRTKELRNSVDSGIRCMDLNDPWVISVYDLDHGTGPGVAALVRQLEHQANDNLQSSMSRLKELIDSGDVVSQAEDEKRRNK